MEVFLYRSLPHSKYMGFGTLGTACGSAPAPRTPTTVGSQGLPRASPFYCRPFGAVRWNRSLPHSKYMGFTDPVRPQHRAPPHCWALGSSLGQPLLLQAIWCSSEVFFLRSLNIANTWGWVHLEPPVARLQHRAPPPLLGPRRFLGPAPSTAGHLVQFRGSFLYRSLPHSKYMGFGTLGTACGSAPAPRTPTTVGSQALPRASPFYCRPFGAVRWKSVYRSLPHSKYMGFGTLGTACGSAPAPRTPTTVGSQGSS